MLARTRYVLQTGTDIGTGTWHTAVLRVMRRSSLVATLAAAPLVALSVGMVSAFAQASSSSDAQGKVTDATGATVPGATFHLTNIGTGAERSTSTNDSGKWSIPNIPPATYRLRVEKQGFKTNQIQALAVEIGKTANGSLTLAMGGTDETVEVTTLPP